MKNRTGGPLARDSVLSSCYARARDSSLFSILYSLFSILYSSFLILYSPSNLQRELGLHHFVLGRVLHHKTEFLADAEHAAVVGQNPGGQFAELLRGAYGDQPAEQFFA